MIIDSFLAQLGFDVDAKVLDAFEKRTKEARATVLSMVAAAGAAAAAVGGFVTAVAIKVDGLGDFAERNSIAVDALQEMGHAAQIEGAGLDNLKTSIEGVNRVTGEAVLGIGRGAKIFEQLGLESRNAAGEVNGIDAMLEQVADRMQTMSRQEALGMAAKLGIDPAMVPLLQKGAERMRELREEARLFGVASQDDANKAGALTDELDRLKFIAGGLGIKLATGLMPFVTGVMERFKDWYVANKDIIQQRLSTTLNIIAGALSVVWGVVWKVISGITELVSWLSQFKAVTYLATAALAAFVALKIGQFFQAFNFLIVRAVAGMLAFNGAALLIPIAVGAIIAIVALLIDDFLAWQRGAESVIGSLIEKFPALGAVMQGIADTVTSVVAWFRAQWATLDGPLTEAGGHLAELAMVVASVLWPALKLAFEGWALILSAVLPIIAKAIAWVLELAVAVATTLVEAFNGAASVINFVAGKISGFVDGVKDAIDWLKKFLGLSDEVDEKRPAGRGVRRADGSSPRASPSSPEKTSQSAVEAEDSKQSSAPPKARAGRGVRRASSNVVDLIAQAPSVAGAQAEAPRAFGPAAIGGQLGSTTTSNTTNTTNNTTTVGKIEVVSSDPAKAGEAVRRELSRQNKTGIRNGQAGYL